MPSMEDIRFVLEAPQVNRVQKKRPRLVTSCDNCRLKKIKCIQPEPNVICEACSNAHVSCRFRDRERYFAERSRAVSGTAPTQSGSMQKSKATHPDQTSSTSSDLRPDDTTHGGVTRSQAHHTPSYHPYRGVANASPITRSGSESEVSTPEPVLGPLFDPKQPNRPMPNLMMTFIQVFFDNLNVYFPFLAYDETFRQFFEQELSPLLANCIAALAVRYAECAEVTERGNMYVTDLYCDKAKALVAPVIHMPTIDTLHSLILLAWAEFKRNRITVFCAYGQMAVHMAVQMRISDEKIVEQMAHSEYERNMLRSTWASVQQLDLSINANSGAL